MPECVFRLTCELPAAVKVGATWWTIELSYGEKGRHAALIARSKSRTGEFTSGRTRAVEAALSHGIHVPLNTIRHRIALALVKTKRAVILDDNTFF